MIEDKIAIKEMLIILSKAPNSQIDKIITTRLKKLIGKPLPEIKTGIMRAIDDCVCGGLCSEFALESLHVLHEVYLNGKPEDWNDENCPWRKETQ